jgi:hypothetical protein
MIFLKCWIIYSFFLVKQKTLKHNMKQNVKNQWTFSRIHLILYSGSTNKSNPSFFGNFACCPCTNRAGNILEVEMKQNCESKSDSASYKFFRMMLVVCFHARIF